MVNHGKRALALIVAALFVASPAFAQSITTQANSVFRDYNTPGNALSGIYNPPKADVRSLFGLVDTQIPHTADPHTWAATQTLSVAPVFTDAPGSRSALGLGALAILNTPPAPTTSARGGVLSLACSAGQFINSVDTSGTPTCATPTTGSSTAAAGSSGQFQTNSSGSLAGVTISGDVAINGTTGAATLAASIPTAPNFVNGAFGPAWSLYAPSNGVDQKRASIVLDGSGNAVVGMVNDANTVLAQAAVFGRDLGTNLAGRLTLIGGGGLSGNVLNSTYTSTSATTPSWGFLEGNAVTPTGGAFHLPFVVQENTSGGGNHSPLTAILNSSAAGVGAQLVGFQGSTTLTAGSGSAFGGNFVAVANAGVASSAEVVGAEINTTLNANVTRKVGLQIVDAGGSGGGSVIDAGLAIGRGSGSTGYNSGIQFDAGGGSGVKTTGNLIVGPTATVNVGIDFSATTFSSYAFRSPGFSITGAGQVNAALYVAGASAGVDCASGIAASTFRSVGGIVTHC